MPEITLKPAKERSGKSKEVWQEQLITPPKSDDEAPDEPMAALAFPILLPDFPERIE